MLLGLTVHRPWGFGFSDLGKGIENRDWLPPEDQVGGWIALHAGLRLDMEALAWLREAGFELPDDGGPTGIVAVGHLAGAVELVDQGMRYPLGDRAACRAIAESRLHGKPWLFGRFGWCFDEVVPVDPVPCRGAQKLWRVPADETELVRARFRAARRG